MRQRDFPPPRSIDTAAENDRNGIDAPFPPAAVSSLADLFANAILPARKPVAFLQARLYTVYVGLLQVFLQEN